MALSTNVSTPPFALPTNLISLPTNYKFFNSINIWFCWHFVFVVFFFFVFFCFVFSFFYYIYVLFVLLLLLFYLFIFLFFFILFIFFYYYYFFCLIICFLWLIIGYLDVATNLSHVKGSYSTDPIVHSISNRFDFIITGFASYNPWIWGHILFYWHWFCQLIIFYILNFTIWLLAGYCLCHLILC